MSAADRTASTSDARNLGEFYIDELPDSTDLPPSLPDTSGWVRRASRDVIEAGTPYAVLDEVGVLHYVSGRDRDVLVVDNAGQTYWTPPPAPRPPWADISTDRERPTLAALLAGDVRYEGAWWRDDDGVKFGHTDSLWAFFEDIEAVELLHAHDPETHVPVERALIDEAARWAEWADDEDEAGVPRGSRLSTAIVRSLAALADGAQSKGAES